MSRLQLLPGSLAVAAAIAVGPVSALQATDAQGLAAAVQQRYERIRDFRADFTHARPADISEHELASALAELGDEPEARRIAVAIVAARQRQPIQRTRELADIITSATGSRAWRLHPRPGQWNLHPAARTFQALRLLVNRELDNLRHLLRILPACVVPTKKASPYVTLEGAELTFGRGAFVPSALYR